MKVCEICGENMELTKIKYEYIWECQCGNIVDIADDEEGEFLDE